VRRGSNSMASGLTMAVLVVAAVMMATMVVMSRRMAPLVLASRRSMQRKTGLASRFSDAVEAAKVLQKQHAHVVRHQKRLATAAAAQDKASPHAQRSPLLARPQPNPRPAFVPGKHIVDIDAGEEVAGTDVTFHDFDERGAVGGQIASSLREPQRDRAMIGTDVTFHDFNGRQAGDSAASAPPAQGFKSHRVTEAHRRHRAAQGSLGSADGARQTVQAPQTINVASGLGGGVPRSMWVKDHADKPASDRSEGEKKLRSSRPAKVNVGGEKAESQPAPRSVTMRDMEDTVGTNIVFHGVVNEGGILGARRRGIRFNDREMY